MPRSVWLVLTFAALGASPPAWGHGRFPAVVAVVPGPDPSRLLLTTTFGAAITTDGGGSFRWLCEEAMGYSDALIPVFVWPTGEDLIAATSDDLLVSHDGGCSFTPHQDFSGMSPADVAIDPALPRSVVVVTAGFDRDNGMFHSADAGRTFIRVAAAPRGPDLLFSSIRFGAAGSGRWFAAATRQSPRAGLLLRGDDGGARFAEIAVPLTAGEALLVLATNPDNRDHVVLAAASVDHATVFISRDGGNTRTAALALNEAVRNAQFASDGQTLWLASRNRVFISRDGGSSFATLPHPLQNACVGSIALDGNPPRLAACGWPWLDGWALGASADQGATFAPIFQLGDLVGPLACPAGSPARDRCLGYFPALRAEIAGLDPVPNGGAKPDAGSDAAASGGAPTARGCSCRIESGPAQQAGLVVAYLALALVMNLRGRLRGGRHGHPRAARCKLD